VILLLLKVVEFEDRKFRPPQSAAQEDCHNGPVPLIAEGVGIPFLQQRPGLLGGQPVSQAYAQTLRAFDAADANCHIGTQQTG
jgi:hypothetical protein